MSNKSRFPFAFQGRCCGLLSAYNTTCGVPIAAAICTALVLTETSRGASFIRVINSSSESIPPVLYT
jgi:hypothetical protein